MADAATPEITDATPLAAGQRSGKSAPKSAVPSSTGLVGLLGLIAATVAVSTFNIDLASASLLCLAATAAPMMIWAILWERVHLKPTTGMDFSSPRKLDDTIKTTRTKLVGLWVTWGVIALAYSVFTFYEAPRYQLYFTALKLFAPALLLLSILYVFFVDRYMAEPRDALWHAGRLITRGWQCVDPERVKDHARSWTIKAFFLAYVVSIVPGVISHVTTPRIDEVLTDPVLFTSFAVAAMFLFDVCFGAVGYVLTIRPLDSHIRSANPFLLAWVATLICYPPFILMGNGSALDYQQGTHEWSTWFAGNDVLLAVWGALLIVLTAIYAWATVIFGLRFSNLTHRGILTNGPFRFFKHPAYLSKNLFWWLSYLPFLSTEGGWEAVRNCILLGIVNVIYYIRAKTEERHLNQDPDYLAYSAWIARNGVLARLRAWVLRS